jgi:hypothetical protein
MCRIGPPCDAKVGGMCRQGIPLRPDIGGPGSWLEHRIPRPARPSPGRRGLLLRAFGPVPNDQFPRVGEEVASEEFLGGNSGVGYVSGLQRRIESRS